MRFPFPVATHIIRRFNKKSDVKALLAKEHNVAPDDVLLAAGSSEAIVNIADILGRDGPLIIAGTTFALYENRTRVNQVQLNHHPAETVELKPDGRYDLEGIHSAVERNRLHSKPFAVIVEPNNPTGTGVGKTALLSFAQKLHTDIPLIVDGAYHGFSRDVASTAEILQAHPKSIVLATPSKQDGLAGVRAGVAITKDPTLKIALRRRLIPFNVSTTALRQWKTALLDPRLRAKTIASVHASRTFFEQQNWVAYRSHTNFMTVFVNDHPDVVTRELAKQGFEIRSMSDQGPAVRGCVRISFGTPEQNKRIVELLSPYAHRWPVRSTRDSTIALAQLLHDPRIAALYEQARLHQPA